MTDTIFSWKVPASQLAELHKILTDGAVTAMRAGEYPVMQDCADAIVEVEAELAAIGRWNAAAHAGYLARQPYEGRHRAGE